MLEHQKLTEQVIGAAIAVHKALGPGFLESAYENALAVELERRGLSFERQKDVAITYAGQEVGRHRLDLFVSGILVVELKAIKAVEPVHFVVVKSYLRAVGQPHGLILNFAGATLKPHRVKFDP